MQRDAEPCPGDACAIIGGVGGHSKQVNEEDHFRGSFPGENQMG